MKKALYTLGIAVSIFTTANAQLPNGSIAPNFTLTDIDGVTHDLYSYLDAGKTVYIDVFAAHCPPCWNYKGTQAMKNLYLNYGPTGTVNQDIIILAIEHDPNNGYNELHGISGSTQGDWVSTSLYPIINPEGADRTNFINTFDATFYPLIYGICPDRRIKNVGTLNTNGLYNYQTGTCLAAAGIEDISENELVIGYNSTLNSIQVTNASGNLFLTDLSGKTILSNIVVENAKSIVVGELTTGIYVVNLVTETGVKTGKVFID